MKSWKIIGVAALAATCGCGPKDGSRDFEKAKAAYAVHDLVKADKLFAAALAVAPDDVDRLLYAARVKFDLGELDAAKELAARAALSAEDDADVILFGAQVAWHMREYRTAAAGFAALANDAKQPAEIRAQAWVGLGLVELSGNNSHLARIDFLRAMRLDRRNAAARYHLGLVYQDLGYHEAALEQFNAFVHLDEEASVRVQRVQQKTIPALQESVARAAAERPGVAKRDPAACAGAIAKAEAALKKNNVKSARTAYEEALKADPLSYPAALGLARAWERSDATTAGQQKAFEAYRTACTLSPSAVKTFLAAGALSAKLGQHAQAAEIYSRAVAASPTSLEAIDGLIRALRKTNRAKVAQAYQLYRDSLAAK